MSGIWMVHVLMVGTKDVVKAAQPFENGIIWKVRISFKCFWILNGQISDPHCIVLFEMNSDEDNKLTFAPLLRCQNV